MIIDSQIFAPITLTNYEFVQGKDYYKNYYLPNDCQLPIQLSWSLELIISLQSNLHILAYKAIMYVNYQWQYITA